MLHRVRNPLSQWTMGGPSRHRIIDPARDGAFLWAARRSARRRFHSPCPCSDCLPDSIAASRARSSGERVASMANRASTLTAPDFAALGLSGCRKSFAGKVDASVGSIPIHSRKKRLSFIDGSLYISLLTPLNTSANQSHSALGSKIPVDARLY